MGGMQIQSLIAGVVVFVISLVLFEPLARGADTLYREFITHCESAAGDSTVRVKVTETSGDVIDHVGTGVNAIVDPLRLVTNIKPAPGTLLTLTTGATSCTIPVTADVADGHVASSPTGASTSGAKAEVYITMETEGGTTITAHATEVVAVGGRKLNQASTSIAGYTTVTPAETLTKFGGINKLVLSLLPLVVVVGFMSTSFMSLYANRSGGQSVGNTIKAEVGALVIALIAIFISPIALDYIATSSVVVSDGQLTSTKEFGLIMELLFGFMPVGLTLGIIALVGWRGTKAYSGMKGGGGMMG